MLGESEKMDASLQHASCENVKHVPLVVDPLLLLDIAESRACDSRIRRSASNATKESLSGDSDAWLLFGVFIPAVFTRKAKLEV